MKWLLLVLAALGLVSCGDTIEVEREIGYKGKARINPWLAAERFSAQYGSEVKSLPSWTAPDGEDALWFVPVSILGNESFIRQIEQWVVDGGHLVVLVDYSESEISDWNARTNVRIEPPLVRMLERSGIELDESSSSSDETAVSEIDFEGERYQVTASSRSRVKTGDHDPGVFASTSTGAGRITVLTDARLFRNRWIGDKDHAALLDALFQATEYHGAIGFIRGSGLSIWGMLVTHLWPVLVGLAVLTLLWLWKNFARFGPVESASPASELRGYDHHLEALGDFQWRLDKAAALLVPLRAQILERGQRVATRAGKRDDDFFQFLADRAGIPRERVQRALVEAAPADTSVLTRTAADLQRLLKDLH